MIKKIITNIFVLVFLITNSSYADIKFWTTEVQPERMAKQEKMAKAFEAKRFHLRNGAVELQVNEETQNFEYKVIK